MRFVALAVILASLPAFIAWLQSKPAARDQAIFFLGILLFMVGTLQTDAAIYSMVGWPGTSMGILLSPVDTLALALIATRGAKNNRIPFAAISLLWLVPTALSIVVSSAPIASSLALFQGIQLIIFATAIAGELTRPTALPRLMAGLSIGLIVQAGYVVQQKLAGVVQATGTLDHQNSLGMMVELAVLPLIGYVLEGGRGKLVYGGVAAGLIVAAGGGSRGTLLFLTIGIAVLVTCSLMRGMTPHKAKVLGAGLAAAAVVVPLSLATLGDRFGERTMITEESEREAFKRAAREIAADHPLGAGANTYVTVANTEGYSERAGVNWNFGSRRAPVHHAFLLTRAEVGRLGEWLLYALIGLSIWQGLRVSRRLPAPQLAGVTMGAGAAAVALMAHNHYEYVFALSVVQRIFWLNAGIIAAALVVERQLAAKARQRRLAPVTARKGASTPGSDCAGGPHLPAGDGRPA